MKPDPLLTVSEWADKYRMLSQRASAEPGQWRTSRTPYLQDIMDCLSATDPTQTVIFCSGAQTGKTEAGNNWLGYVIDHAPGPIMAVQPTVEMAKRNSKQRIEPLISECPRLRERVKPSRARDSGNTILTKEFPGGVMVLTGANSAVGLRSLPARYLFLDEIDAYPGDVDGEGDPVALAEARARTFARRKIFKVSTPTIAGRSRIAAAYEDSDQRRYEVPCPHCGTYQAIVWKNIKWPDGKPSEAVLICEGCQRAIQEHYKTKMLAKGRWVARKPERANKKTVGFHLSSLYSPVGWFSWADAAELWEQAQGNQMRLRSFVNTVLGETWKEKGEAPDWHRLYERRESYEFNRVPAGAVFITAGADIQKERIECEIVAWGADKQSWSLDYRVFAGDTSGEAVWKDLFAVLNETFPCEDGGGQMPIRLMAIDSGFNTQAVYNQVRKFPSNRVIAVKGSAWLDTIIGKPAAVDVDTRGRTIRRGVRIWSVGTNLIKTELYGWLRLDAPTDGDEYPPGYCHFPEYDSEYFKMLTAEQIVLRQTRNGGRKYEWEKIRDRNESLDTRVYARAAACLLGLDRLRPDQLSVIRSRAVTPIAANQTVNPAVQTQPVAKPARRESSYW